MELCVYQVTPGLSCSFEVSRRSGQAILANETLLARVVLVVKQTMHHSGQIGEKLDYDDY